MNREFGKMPLRPVLVSMMHMLKDFARYAGIKGAKAFVFVFLGALVELEQHTDGGQE